MARIMTTTELRQIATKIEDDRIVITYPESMRADQVPDLVVDGVRWVAMTGSRVDEHLAEQRKIAREQHGIPWSDGMCKPHYAACYYKWTSALYGSIGRM